MKTVRLQRGSQIHSFTILLLSHVQNKRLLSKISSHCPWRVTIWMTIESNSSISNKHLSSPSLFLLAPPAHLFPMLPEKGQRDSCTRRYTSTHTPIHILCPLKKQVGKATNAHKKKLSGSFHLFILKSHAAAHKFVYKGRFPD